MIIFLFGFINFNYVNGCKVLTSIFLMNNDVLFIFCVSLTLKTGYLGVFDHFIIVILIVAVIECLTEEEIPGVQVYYALEF